MPSSEVFHKWKAGKLHSGSKHGPQVKSHAQAIAIYLSEKRKEGQHGGKYPEKKQSGGRVAVLTIGDHTVREMPTGGWGVYKTSGQPFDPNIHEPISLHSTKEEAISQVPGRQSGGPVGASNIKGLARAIDQAHRHHAGKPHPSTIDYQGKTYNLGKAFGGPNLNMENMIMRGASYGLRREGMINSAVPGRTDKLPMNVRSGSYVLPADIPSALGQGNSMAGGQILKKMFSSGPYGLPVMHGARGSGQPKMRMQTPRLPKGGMFAKGGEAGIWRQIRKEHEHVPIIAAGGEFLIHPDVVRDIGHGDIEAGHKVLDTFVLNTRKKYAETLKNLPGPKT